MRGLAASRDRRLSSGGYAQGYNTQAVPLRRHVPGALFLGVPLDVNPLLIYLDMRGLHPHGNWTCLDMI